MIYDIMLLLQFIILAMLKCQHPERLSLQGFNIAGGLLDTWRQSQRKFNIVVLRLPPSSSREITLSPILSACKSWRSSKLLKFPNSQCHLERKHVVHRTPKIDFIVFSTELLPSGATMQKHAKAIVGWWPVLETQTGTLKA